MKPFIALVLAAASLPAFAGDDVFQDLKRGDRVLITTKDGGNFKGVVKSVVGDNLRVEVTYDSNEAVGSVVFERENVKRVLKLGAVNPEDFDRVVKEKEEAAKPKDTEKPKDETTENGGKVTEEDKEKELLAKFPPSEWNDERKAAIEAADAFVRSDEEKEFLASYDAWKKAAEKQNKVSRLELLKKFPPKDGWGPEKHETLKNTTAVIGRALTDDEKEFVDHFEEWKQALAEFEEASKTPEPEPEPENEGEGEGEEPK